MKRKRRYEWSDFLRDEGDNKKLHDHIKSEYENDLNIFAKSGCTLEWLYLRAYANAMNYVLFKDNELTVLKENK